MSLANKILDWWNYRITFFEQASILLALAGAAIVFGCVAWIRLYP